MPDLVEIFYINKSRPPKPMDGVLFVFLWIVALIGFIGISCAIVWIMR